MTEEPDPPSALKAAIGEARSSCFAHAIDRRLVHRRSIAEVYVTGYTPAGADGFIVYAQWPRHHRLYCPGGHYHPTLLLETMRQAVLAVCLGILQVPDGSHFVMSRIHADGLDRLPPVGAAPTDVTMELARTAGPGTHRSHWDLRIHAGPHARLAGGGDLTVLSARQYDRVRRGYAGRFRPAIATTPVDPSAVGRTCARDVVLATPADGRGRLHIDQSHPVFYDHPVDHVPGALLLEAAFQYAHSEHLDFHPAGIDALFHAFIEPDQLCTIDATATRRPATGLALAFDQHDTRKATVTLQASHP